MPDDPVELLARKYGGAAPSEPDPVDALAAKYGGTATAEAPMARTPGNVELDGPWPKTFTVTTKSMDPTGTRGSVETRDVTVKNRAEYFAMKSGWSEATPLTKEKPVADSGPYIPPKGIRDFAALPASDRAGFVESVNDRTRAENDAADRATHGYLRRSLVDAPADLVTAFGQSASKGAVAFNEGLDKVRQTGETFAKNALDRSARTPFQSREDVAPDETIAGARSYVERTAEAQSPGTKAITSVTDPIGEMAGGIASSLVAGPRFFSLVEGLKHPDDPVRAAAEAELFMRFQGALGKAMAGADPTTIDRIASTVGSTWIASVAGGEDPVKALGAAFAFGGHEAMRRVEPRMGVNNPGATATERMTPTETARVVNEAVASGQVTEREAFSPERVAVAEAAAAKGGDPVAAVDAMLKIERPDGSVAEASGLENPTLDPRVAPTVEAARAKGVETVSSGMGEDGRPFVIGKSPTGETVVERGESPRETPEWKAAAETAESHGLDKESAASIADEIVADKAKPKDPVTNTDPAVEIPEPDVTGIKNDVVNAEREARGEAPVEKGPTRSKDIVESEARSAVTNDPTYPERLAKEVAAKPRPLTDVEDTVLAMRRVDLRKAYRKALEDVATAAERGDADGVARAQTAKEQILEASRVAEEAADAAGGANARGLAARRWLMDDAYNVVTMTLEARALNDGKPLSKNQTAEIEALAAAHEKTKAELQAVLERATAAESALALAKIEASQRSPSRERPGYGKRNKVVTTEAYEAAKAAMREKLSRMSAGFAGLDAIPELVKIAAYHAEAGVRTLADFVAKVKEDAAEHFGKVEPFLREAWDRASKESADATVAEIRAEAKAATKDGKALESDALQNFAGQLAEAAIRSGIHGPENVGKYVHDILKEVVPGITPSETNRAIVKYGDVVKMNDDPVKVELRDTKAQIVQMERLLDIASGKLPPPQGLQRDAQSDALRQLVRLVNEAKRSSGLVAVDPAKQLRSALDAVKTRLKHAISDMTREIAAGKKDVPNRTEVPLDAEAMALKAQRDALAKQYNEVFARPGLTDAQRLDMAIKATEKSIVDLERRANTGDVFPAENAKTAPTDPRLAALQAKREALRQRIRDIREAATPRGETADQRDVRVAEAQRRAEIAKAEAAIRTVEESIAEWERKIKTGDVFPEAKGEAKPVDPRLAELRRQRDELRQVAADMRDAASPKDSAVVKAAKARLRALEKRKAEMERQIEKNDFAKKQKAERVPTPEEIKARADMLTVERAWQAKKEQYLLDNETRAAQAARIAFREVPSLHRVFNITFDLGATLVQGGLRALGHPIAMARTFKKGLKSLVSEEARTLDDARLMSDPGYADAVKQKVGLTGLEPGRIVDEAVRSQWLHKIPVLRNFERFTHTMLNNMRLDASKALTATLSRTGTPTPSEMRAIGDGVNIITGRGVARNHQANALLDSAGNTFFGFFAPRFVVSRFQGALGVPMWRGSARTRKAFATEYVRMAAGVGVLLGIAKAFGQDVDKYGTISIGNTKIDTTMGMAQVWKLAQKSYVALAGSDEDRKGQAQDFVERYMRQKLAPIPGAFVSMAHGKTIDRRDATLENIATDSVTPLLWKDVRAAAAEHGIPMTVLLTGLSAIGMRVQTLPPKPEKPKKRKW